MMTMLDRCCDCENPGCNIGNTSSPIPSAGNEEAGPRVGVPNYSSFNKEAGPCVGIHLEQAGWNMAERRLGGGEAEVIEVDIVEEFSWVPETDISETESDEVMPDHYFDYCYGTHMISTMDENWNNVGCKIATEADEFEVYVHNFIQQIIDDEELHIELFKEEKVMEAVDNDIPEEEKDPPLNLDESEFEHLILAVDEDKGTNIAQKIKRRLLNMMKVKRGLTVDSGAADHVMPMGWLPVFLFAIMQSIGSRSGLHYVAADGTRIPNMGQQLVRFMTLDGQWVELMFQVAAINKPLASVSKLTEQGYRVVFDDESYIYHKKSKQVIKMRKERGVYVVDAYVPKKADSGFTRPR